MTNSVYQMYLAFSESHAESIIDLCSYKMGELHRELTKHSNTIAKSIVEPSDNVSASMIVFDQGMDVGKHMNLLSEVMTKVKRAGETGQSINFEPEEFKVLTELINDRLNLQNSFIYNYSCIYNEYLCNPEYTNNTTQKQALNCIERYELEYRSLLAIKIEITQQVKRNTF